jgi:hypothetical protein
MLSSQSKDIYFSAIRNHLHGVNLNNKIDVLDKISNLTIPLKIQCLKAVLHVTRDTSILQNITDLQEEYKSNLMEKKIDAIDWAFILNRLHSRRKQSLTAFQSFIMGLYMYHHPRRFGDYLNLSNKDGPNVNVYDGKMITFKKFKNINSKTCGDKFVICHPQIKLWTDIYIKKYAISGRFFAMSGRSFRNLCKKAQLPLCNHNRKYQESSEIQSGILSRAEIARKFNHSLAVQCISYQKKLTDSPNV